MNYRYIQSTCIIVLALCLGLSNVFGQDLLEIQQSKKAKQDTARIHIQWKEPPQVSSSEIKIDFTEKQQGEFEKDILFSKKGLQISASKETGIFISKEIKVPIESPEPFLAVSSVWTTEGSDDGLVTLSVRGSPDGRKWTEWLDISVDEHATPQPGEFFGNLMFLDRETRYVQYRFTLETRSKPVSPAVTGLRIICISPGATPKEVLDEIKKLEPRHQKQFDEELRFPRLDELQQIDSINRDGTLLQIPRPTFVSRTTWGCQEGQLSPRWTPTLTTVTHLIIHHTVNSNTSPDWSAVVRAIWVQHANTNGWGDIGYNWLVDPNGIIYQGRAWRQDTDDNVIGAHFCGTNSNTMGVAALGTFTSVSPTSSAITRIRDLLAWKSNQRSIDPRGISFHAASGLNLYNIPGHQDGCATVCPGNNLYAQLPTIRNRVYALLTPPTATTNAASDVTQNSATLRGTVNPRGTLSGFFFQWGTSTAYGNSTSNQIVGSGTSDVTVSAPVSALQPNTTYHFRLVVANTDTFSIGQNQSFTTPSQTPQAPTLASPSNGATGITTNPTLSWTSSSGATSYRLQVSTNSSFTTLVFDQSGITGTSQQVSGLANNTLYYWRVNATNAGGTSSYSSTRSFTTIVAAPTAPTLASPSDGATGIATNPTLSWNSSTGATSYRLQVSTSSGFSSTVYDQDGITGTSQQVPGLANNTLYYWRVNATNAGGTSSYSSTRSFTTIVAAPAAPTLASPSDGATGVATNPTLSWNASSGATSYRLQVSTSSGFSSTVYDQDGITGTSQQVPGLANNTLYYWRVNATNAGGTSSYSSTRSFTTIVAAPTAPTLASPSDGATGVATNPTLSWNSSTGATSYRLQVSTSSGFSSTVYDQDGITGTSQQVSGLANNTLYYWRVNATNAGGTSSYSSTRSFTTIVAAPTAPTLASPSDGATGIATNPTLSWNSSTGATSYRLQVSTSSGFSSTVYDQGGITGTSQQVSGLANNTLYYWRVNATNAGGTSDWSSFWNFTTTDPSSVERFNSEIPTAYHLAQNYPNPFNPITTIQFSLPKESPVVLTIFNSRGMEIEVLVNQNLPAGHYRTQWAPRNTPSGVYFYQLKSTEFTNTKKLLLLR